MRMIIVYILPQGDCASTSNNKSGSENWLRSVKWWCYALTYQNVHRQWIGLSAMEEEALAFVVAEILRQFKDTDKCKDCRVNWLV